MAQRTHFRFLTGDVNWQDYGGKFFRRVGPGRYHVMTVLNWVDTVGEREAAEVGATYNVELAEVDVLATSEAQKAEAASSWGWTVDEVAEHAGKGKVEHVWVELLHSVGSKAPLWDRDGNNINKLMKACRAESLSLDNPQKYERAMSRPVNRLGTTAREYMQNDIASALTRGLIEGNPESQIVAKCYGVPQKIIDQYAAIGALQ